MVNILARLNCPDVHLGSDNPVLLVREDAEVVGDGTAEFEPFVWQCFPEETQNGFCELIERGVMAIVGHAFVHDAPETLDRVEMRCVGWQKMQFHSALWIGQPWLQYFGVVIPGIVEKHVDCRLGWVVTLQFCEHLLRCFGVDLLGFHKGELEGLQIKRALDVEPLAS